MNDLWRMHATNSGDKEEDELVLNAFTGFCFPCRRKDPPRAHECPEKKGDARSTHFEKLGQHCNNQHW
jgi:hypothetical protein